MDLISMQRTKSEKKEDTGPEVATEYERPDYPYGLEISLEEESMEKLGLDVENFSVGGKIELVCNGEITRTHESAGKDHNNSSVSIQITDMAIMVHPNETPKTIKDILAVIKGGA